MNSKFSLKYGTVEVVAKLPSGKWLWPAIWMMPTGSKYGGWPKSGEIDIMESAGNVGCRNRNPSYFVSTLHFGSSGSTDMFGRASKSYSGEDLSKDFHTYKLEWSA